MSEKKPKREVPGGPGGRPKGPGLFSLIKPYRALVYSLVALTIGAACIQLIFPHINGHGIDAFMAGPPITRFVWQLFAASCVSFVLTFAISFVQTYIAERVARDLRNKLTDRISRQDYAFLQKKPPAQLLTNLTSDVDSIKVFISQVVATIYSSLFVILGASYFLIRIKWQLALWVIAIIPIIGLTFWIILKKVRVVFKASRM